MDRQQLEELMRKKRQPVTPVDLMQTSKPAIPQADKPVNQQTSKRALTKYSTWLPANVIRAVKLRAVAEDVKDYQIVTRALEAYLEKEINDRTAGA